MSAGTVPADIKKSEKGKLVGLVDTVQHMVLTENIHHGTGELGAGLKILDGEEGLLIASCDNVDGGVFSKTC